MNVMLQCAGSGEVAICPDALLQGGVAPVQMDVEDGIIWVYGDAEDGVMAFTDFGIENLIELIKMHKDDPTIIERCNARGQAHSGPRRMDTESLQ